MKLADAVAILAPDILSGWLLIPHSDVLLGTLAGSDASGANSAGLCWPQASRPFDTGRLTWQDMDAKDDVRNPSAFIVKAHAQHSCCKPRSHVTRATVRRRCLLSRSRASLKQQQLESNSCIPTFETISLLGITF